MYQLLCIAATTLGEGHHQWVLCVTLMMDDGGGLSCCRVSKKIMESSGVPIVPGYFGDDQSDERLRMEAEKLGWV